MVVKRGKQIYVSEDYYRYLKASSGAAGCTIVEFTKRLAKDNKEIIDRLRR